MPGLSHISRIFAGIKAMHTLGLHLY
jgi:hypothetical protein